jgi:aminoglycoside phosphotransferase (APT) family kinase protein
MRRFNGLWAHNKTREIPLIETVETWLLEHMPESGPATIVHGDYRLGNTMFARGTPARLNAIFDWELSTIGDPLADVGYLTATYAQPGDDERLAGTLSPVTTWDGFPTRDDLIARYEERSGRSMANVRWYQSFALWKSAVFLEGSYGRLLAGTTDDPFFKLLEEGIPELAKRAWVIAQAN